MVKLCSGHLETCTSIENRTSKILANPILSSYAYRRKNKKKRKKKKKETSRLHYFGLKCLLKNRNKLMIENNLRYIFPSWDSSQSTRIRSDRKNSQTKCNHDERFLKKMFLSSDTHPRCSKTQHPSAKCWKIFMLSWSLRWFRVEMKLKNLFTQLIQLPMYIYAQILFLSIGLFVCESGGWISGVVFLHMWTFCYSGPVELVYH